MLYGLDNSTDEKLDVSSQTILFERFNPRLAKDYQPTPIPLGPEIRSESRCVESTKG
jgi:hypothetical protein